MKAEMSGLVPRLGIVVAMAALQMGCSVKAEMGEVMAWPALPSQDQVRSAPKDLTVAAEGEMAAVNSIEFEGSQDEQTLDRGYTATENGRLELVLGSSMAVGCPSAPQLQLTWIRWDENGTEMESLPVDPNSGVVEVVQGTRYTLRVQARGLQGCMSYQAAVMAKLARSAEPVRPPAPTPAPATEEESLGEVALEVGTLSMRISSFEKPVIYKDFRLAPALAAREFYFGYFSQATSCAKKPLITKEWYRVQQDGTLALVASSPTLSSLKAEANEQYVLRLKASDYEACNFVSYSFEVRD